MKLSYFLTGIFCLAALGAQAQVKDGKVLREAGQVLVQTAPGTNIRQVISTVRPLLPVTANLQWERSPAPAWHVHLLRFEETNVAMEQVLGLLRDAAGVQVAQPNRYTEERDKTPNDDNWYQQADMGLINMPQSWDFSTGGLMTSRDSIAPDTIVVAVLEKGAFLPHPDLMPNRWYNYAEVPDNNKDDDGNGFVDDFDGWNPKRQSDSMNLKSTHGTSVNGIIGAKGNNDLGVSGLNWNIKLMNFSEIIKEDEIVEAYYYAGQMRKRYNESNGKQGAFVVTTNASFGIDTAFPNEFPLWCAIYDSIGKVGIVSVAATTNVDRNVDVEGDMPTTCKSEYLITVTNTDNFGNKVDDAGYGSTSIDLGAPGDGTYTTRSTQTAPLEPLYGAFDGTSAACPHVSGAVAFLYSLGCKQFTNDALTDPVSCARRVRDVVLESVAPDKSLEGRSTTGGYLDVEGAIKKVFEICKGSVGPLGISEVRSFQNEERFIVYYQTPNFSRPYNFRVFNALGQLMLERTLRPVEFQENYVEFDLLNQPAGMYVLSFSIGKATVSKSFVKF